MASHEFSLTQALKNYSGESDEAILSTLMCAITVKELSAYRFLIFDCAFADHDSSDKFPFVKLFKKIKFYQMFGNGYLK